MAQATVPPGSASTSKSGMVGRRLRGRQLRGLMQAVGYWVGLGSYVVTYIFCREGNVRGWGGKHRGSGIGLDCNWKT